MPPLRPLIPHHGYEYGDCADAAWMSPSSTAAQIANRMIGKGMAVLRCIDRTDRRTLDRERPQSAQRSAR
jgi:hypothetical protein